MGRGAKEGRIKTLVDLYIWRDDLGAHVGTADHNADVNVLR